jgi:hypothetical protein
MVLHQADSCYIDLYGASFLLAGLAFFLARSDLSGQVDGDRWYMIALALAGCAWSVAIGTKLTLYPYASILILGAVIALWQENRGWSRRLSRTCLLVGGALIFCAFWLLRSWIEGGHPFYPIAIKLFGHVLFAGVNMDEFMPSDYDLRYMPFRIGWLVYPWLEYNAPNNNFGVDAGLGAVFAVVVPVGIVYGVSSAFLSRKSDNSSTYRISFLGWAFMAMVWFIALKRVPRYGLPLPIFSAILSIPLIDFLLRYNPQKLRALVLTSVVIMAGLAAFAPAHAFLGRVRSAAWTRAQVYEYPALIDRLPSGTVIWVLAEKVGGSSAQHFILVGEKLTNRVTRKLWAEIAEPRQFIRDERIDYIAYTESEKGTEEDIARIGGQLVFDNRVGPTHFWKIWDVRAVWQGTP